MRAIDSTYGAFTAACKMLALMVFATLAGAPGAAETRAAAAAGSDSATAAQAGGGKVHLIAFGDSLTAGWGLLDHEGFVPVLRQWMKAQGEDVRIVLAGVSGDTTSGGLARLDWALSDELQGIILELGANDMLRGLDPALARENLRKMLEIADARDLEVLLVGVPVAGNFGPGYKASFEAIWPDLAAEFDVALYPDFLSALGATPQQARPFLQEDGIHPNAQGVRRIVADIGPAVRALTRRIRAK